MFFDFISFVKLRRLSLFIFKIKVNVWQVQFYNIHFVLQVKGGGGGGGHLGLEQHKKVNNDRTFL